MEVTFSKNPAAKEQTCTENGNEEYWHCTYCDKYFSDEDCTTEVCTVCKEKVKEGTVIPKLEHDWDTPSYRCAD